MTVVPDQFNVVKALATAKVLLFAQLVADGAEVHGICNDFRIGLVTTTKEGMD